jgi:hypothetical protein
MVESMNPCPHTLVVSHPTTDAYQAGLGVD